MKKLSALMFFIWTVSACASGVSDSSKNPVEIFYMGNYRPVVRLENIGPMSESVKAILAMYALQVGGGCQQNNGSELRCALTESLGLGVQCSDQHVGIVQSWFKKGMPQMSGHSEKVIEKSLRNGKLKDICYNIPDTATRQRTWERIRLSKIRDDAVSIDATVNWTAGAEGPSGQVKYHTEYKMDKDQVIVIQHSIVH